MRVLGAIAAAALSTLGLSGCGSDTTTTVSPIPVTCSFEICNISEGGQTVNLEARTYYIDRQVVLPAGTRLVGAGIGNTFIAASGGILKRKDYCRNKNECRRGFILTDNTYVSGFTFQGRDRGRWGDNDCLFGGAPLETPGCQDSYCRPHGDAECGIEGVIAGTDFCTAGGCEGVSNVTAEDIQVEAYSTQTVVWVPLNPPGNKTCSNLTFRRLSTDGAWADGINIHGEHSDVLVADSIMRNTGDDGFAIWSNGDKLTNVVFRNNTMEFPRCCNRVWDGEPDMPPPALDCSNSTTGGSLPYPGWGVNCFAMYGGGKGNQVIDNHCVSTYWGFMAFHGAVPGDLGFHGDFAEDAVVNMSGNTVSSGAGQGPSCCTDCPICFWKSNDTSKWQEGLKPQVEGHDCHQAQVRQI